MRKLWPAIFGFAVFFGLSTPFGAEAADNYRFCVAVSFEQKITYLTDIFANGQSQNVLEGQFDRQLAQAGIERTNVQCPFPTDRLAAFDARRMAQQFNEQLGYEVRKIAIKGISQAMSQR